MVRVTKLLIPLLALLGLAAGLPAAHAGSAPFDLAGPRIRVAVTHDGMTLPIEWVPNLAPGDRLSIKLDLPEGQRTRYRLIAAFLRGATDRPPRDWFHDAETWDEDENQLSLVVPAGAKQAVLFLMPEDGGDFDAVVDMVRDRPGTFVRAVQELNQAALDRARLDAFLRGVRAVEQRDPTRIDDASKALTRSLAIRLDAACLRQPVDLQAACLTQDRESLLLADTHSSSLASTLVGAPTDLALQLSATPQGGYGYYSPYIGVVRDIFRIFGAFESTQLQYIPALARLHDGRGGLLLNAPLSFGKPTSVMVAALPAIEPAKPPPLRPTHPGRLLCAAPGMALPVDGAPLVFATRYARDMALRLTGKGGTTIDLPVVADAERGGFVLTGTLPSDKLAPDVEARLHGRWGFTAFDGPRFTLSNPAAGAWRAEGNTSLVVGRDNGLSLNGGPAGCVSSVTMRPQGGSAQPIAWSATDAGRLTLTLPLGKAKAGPVTLLIHQTGTDAPQTVTLPATEEAAAIDRLTFHAGDPAAVLTGTRLDQVGQVKLGPVIFRPDGLERDGRRDRLTLAAADPAAAAELAAGQRLTAIVALAGGRDRQLMATIAPPRARARILSLSTQRGAAGDTLPVTLSADGFVPQDARLTFAFRLTGDTPLTGRETIEIAAAEGGTATVAAGKGYDLQDARTGIVSMIPADALGPMTKGALRFRVLRGDTASAWTPLATVVRLPAISAIDCDSDRRCTLSGTRLFLIEAIATDPRLTDAVAVPDGFTATAIPVPATKDGRLFLKLRDDPNAIATVRRR
ncbi:hypothetical protein [Stakelama saccharophila]|uniref:Uncharacterized protein n=1 Tax=Stakelama saccharophila TaxID=3075605 RepID=A0ABZ0BAD7_9SPHN|nr:hypothetical protein [Stakelama sp. W311]WNO54382.1 hypothetical protein RPR59_03755 [Stakelama sp. W311]